MGNRKQMGIAELGASTGKDNSPARISVNGKVYDVSASKLWKNGIHMMRHYAGHELDSDLKAAPHGAEVLERVPQIGLLVKTEEKISKREEFFAGLFKKYPILKKHPHPMTVHFPPSSTVVVKQNVDSLMMTSRG